MAIYRDDITVLLAMLALGVISLTLLFVAGRRYAVVPAALVAFFLRLAAGLAQVWTIGLVDDAGVYDSAARALVGSWTGELGGVELTSGKEGWPTILAVTYWVFGHAPEVGIILNAAAGAAAVVVVAAACRNFGLSASSGIAAWIVALWPVGWVWGGYLLREALVQLLLALAVLGVAKARQRATLSGGTIILLSGTALILMRGGLALLVLIVMPSLLIAEVVLPREGASRGRPVTVMVALALSLLALPMAFGLLEDAPYFDPQRLERVSQALNAGTTSFASAGVDPSVSPMTYVLVAAGPYVWQWHNVGLVIAGIDGLMWLMVWLLAIRGATVVGTWTAAHLGIPAVLVLAYVAQTSTNFGLIMRFRGLLVVFLAPLAAAAVQHLRDRRTRTGRSPVAECSHGARGALPMAPGARRVPWRAGGGSASPVARPIESRRKRTPTASAAVPRYLPE